MIPSPSAAWARQTVRQAAELPYSYNRLYCEEGDQQDRKTPAAQRSTGLRGAPREARLDISVFSGRICKCFPVARGGLADLEARAGGVLRDTTTTNARDTTARLGARSLTSSFNGGWPA